MRRYIPVILALSIAFSNLSAQDNLSALLPMPNKIEVINGKKEFTVTDKTVIATNLPDSSFCITELQSILQKHTGITPAVSGNNKEKHAIQVMLNPSVTGNERYILSVSGNTVKIEGATANAIFYGIMTLDQILIGDNCRTKAKKIAAIEIDDTPRFGYRSMMLDPARNFLPVSDIKLFIDRMVRYKYNILQLHLTDDPGWRIEIKKYPQLTKEREFYTQEELKDIVRYASERGVEVIPELDIPGHTVSFLAAYPEFGCTNTDTVPKIPEKTRDMMLCASNDKIYSMYKDIIAEVAAIFPSQYIHLGGDEAVVAKNWAKCERCMALAKQLGYKNANQLMGYFFEKMLPAVYENGKKPMFWCEIEPNETGEYEYLLDYPDDAVLFTWRNGLTPTCTELTNKNGNKLVMAPGEYAYLDYPQYKNDFPEFNNWGMPVTTLETTYSLDPGYGLPTEKQEHIIGINGTVWGEAITDINRVTYMTYPRGLALAEAGWTQMEHRDWSSFKERMFKNLTEMMKAGISFRVPFEIVREK